MLWLGNIFGLLALLCQVSCSVYLLCDRCSNRLFLQMIFKLHVTQSSLLHYSDYRLACSILQRLPLDQRASHRKHLRTHQQSMPSSHLDQDYSKTRMRVRKIARLGMPWCTNWFHRLARILYKQWTFSTLCMLLSCILLSMLIVWPVYNCALQCLERQARLPPLFRTFLHL